MEYGSRLRFALFTIGAIILLILSIWGVSSIAKSIFKGGSASKQPVVQTIALEDYARPNTVTKMTAEGPIVAEEKFKSYEINVAQDYREIKIYKGYNKSIVSSQRYPNNPEAYENFLKALKKANFTLKNKGSSEDEKGACATGARFIYQVDDDQKEAFRSWGTKCGSLGSSKGQGSAIRNLFESQIPDFRDMAAETDI